MFLPTSREKSINVFKMKERVKRWVGTSKSESGLNKHCIEILNWIKLPWLVQETLSFTTVPSGNFAVRCSLKLTVPLRNSSRRKYDSNVLTNQSWLVLFHYFLLSTGRSNLFPTFCGMLFFFFSIVLWVASCQAMSPFGLQLPHLYWKLLNKLPQLLEKISE